MRTRLYYVGRLGGKGAKGETGRPGSKEAGFPVSGLVGADEGHLPIALSSSPATSWGQRAQRCQLQAPVWPVSPIPVPWASQDTFAYQAEGCMSPRVPASHLH